MEYYFSDRSYNIIGMASTTLKDAIRIYDDLEAEDIDSGLSSFEGKIYFTDDKDGNIDVVTGMCQKGNYILYRNRLGKDRFFTIIETEKDRKENSISFYAEDGGLDLINEVVGPFESTTAQPASFYLEEFLKDSGFTIGLNEIANLSRKLKWEGESSVTSRIRSVATQFDNAEISFSFEIEGMVISKKKVNIHKKRGSEINETLTLGREIDNIKTIESIENLATSLLPKGGTPEGENSVPINLKGYVYDDGRFYVNKDGFVRDREARTIWNRFSTTPSDDTGFINKPFSYDTLSKSELLNRAIGKLKEISKPDQNFIVDIITLPDNVSLGDRINIVDERDNLNLSTRVLKLEIEEGIDKCTALLGEFIIKQKTIGEKLKDIAEDLKDNMKPGDTYYPSVAYADDAEGNGFSMSPDNKAYIAIIHQKNNSIPSTNPKDYEGQWIHIKGLNGDRGEDGLPGKDGVGLKSTTITYAYNKSSLNPPTSGWTSDVPQTPPGDYLWTRTIWKYTDNKEETGYSVSRIGKDGNTGNDGIAGKDGVGLKSTSVNYASSSSGTIIPTSGWSLNIPEVPTGQFLWTRTIWTYTDNTNERGYSVSRMGLNGTNGKDGIAGKDGVGLKQTTIRYAASENGITPPVIWYADIPSVPPGQYLWTQTTWSYTDDTKETGYSVSKIGEDGMKGDDGIAGKDGVGIESTNIQYTASSDGKNPPTTGWTDQIPIVSPGKFLWTRTVWTYTDGTNETGYSISRIGEDGTDGIAGKDGFGLKSTSITYAGSTSGTTAPSSGWSNNVPAVPAGNYLWTKTTWVYTDNTNETGYTVSRIGKDGNTGKDGIAGKDGVGIKSTEITYVSSASGTVTPTGGWTESIPTVTPGQYLWTRTIWTYSDNTTETGYSVARMGLDGSDGISITQVSEYYQINNSPTVAPPDTPAWSTTPINTSTTNRYLWNYEVYTYSNGSTQKTSKKVISVQGVNGSNGSNGISITKVENFYLVSTLNTGVTTSTSGWVTTPPLTTTTNKYLWNYEKITYSSGSPTLTTPCVIGVHGSTGDPGKDGVAGKDGKGITSTVIAYATSTSGTTQPTTGWTPAVPSLTKGQYLWTRTIWTYTDGATETGYSVSYIAKDGNNGTDGIAGKDGVGIKSTAITYAGSTSGTVKPTSGWNTAVPTVAPGNYLWTKTTWTYTDNTTETGYSVARMGANGATGATGPKGDSGKDGVAGKDGKGISSTTITYGLSTTDTVEPTNYTSNVPTLVKGRYLWTKTVWKYTDATTETGYTKTYIAKDGNNGKDGIAGKDGVGISKTTITYAKSTNGTTAPTTGYTTTVPSTNPGDYLWTKTVWTYTDNTTETGYSVGKIGNTGATGATGPQGPKGDRGPQGATGSQGPRGDVGTSITGITEYYLATSASSGVTATTSGWTTSVQTMTATNKYLWNYEKVNFSDGTSQPTVPVIIGAYGDKGATGSTGATGRSITGITEHYLATNLATGVTRSTSGWTTTMQTTTETKRYLWNYETITWSSGTTTTYVEPIVIGVHGLQGPKGAQGIQGPPGANGVSQYVHIRYSANSSGNPMTTTPQSNTAYIGMVTTTSSTAPTGYASYKWSLFKGPQGSTGPQGIQGPKGANGQTTYTWIRYADTPTSGMNQYPDGKKYIGLAFNKTTQTESSNYSDYKWSLMPQNIEIGGRNLLLNSAAERTNNEYRVASYMPSEFMESGNTYTMTICVTPAKNLQDIRLYLSGGYASNATFMISGTGKQVLSKTFKASYAPGRTPDDNPNNGNADLYRFPNNGTITESTTIHWVKLEKGNTATDWTEAPEDVEAKLNEKADQEQVNNALEDINESLEDKIAREEFEKLEKIATEFAKSYEAFVSEGGQYVEDAAKLEERFAQIFVELGANTIDLQFLNTYFRAGEEGLLIGSEDSQIKMLLTNDRLSFQEGSGDNIKEIAYFGGQSFTINSGAIVQDFQIGEHKFTNIGGGHTIVQWTTK